MTVVIMWGDGDGYGIGMGHLIHSCKRNLDMTYLVFNNENYALTTGQASPTTPLWAKTKTTPDWNTSAPFNPLAIAQAAGCQFVKSADSIKFAELKQVIKEAIQFPWFALVDIHQACPSFKRW
jgi:2-oxoglutarate ferredoxin oxidoreductase subunit beta